MRAQGRTIRTRDTHAQTVARLAPTLHARTHTRGSDAWVTSGVWNTRARPRCACTHAESQAGRRERRVPDALEACTAQNRYGESSRIISFTGLRTRDARNPRVNRRPQFRRATSEISTFWIVVVGWLRSSVLYIRAMYEEMVEEAREGLVYFWTCFYLVFITRIISSSLLKNVN